MNNGSKNEKYCDAKISVFLGKQSTHSQMLLPTCRSTGCAFFGDCFRTESILENDAETLAVNGNICYPNMDKFSFETFELSSSNHGSAWLSNKYKGK